MRLGEQLLNLIDSPGFDGVRHPDGSVNVRGVHSCGQAYFFLSIVRPWEPD